MLLKGVCSPAILEEADNFVVDYDEIPITDYDGEKLEDYS